MYGNFFLFRSYTVTVGRGKSGGDATKFWLRYSVAKKDKPDKEVQLEAGIRASSTLSNYKTRHQFPPVDVAIALADAVGTSVEFLVRGTKPKYLSSAECSLYALATAWRGVLRDLDSLPPPVAQSWAAGIHGAALAARPPRAEGEVDPPTLEDLYVAENARGFYEHSPAPEADPDSKKAL